jgi:ribosome-binding ATPase YchF (GTP1/OBG family)
LSIVKIRTSPQEHDRQKQRFCGERHLPRRSNQLLIAGSEANARAKGILRLEGKDYIVQDGDVLHIRHSG